MAIYKSSFNQKPEKEEKPKKEKKQKVKIAKEKVSKKINVRPSLVCLLVFLTIFIVLHKGFWVGLKTVLTDSLNLNICNMNG